MNQTFTKIVRISATLVAIVGLVTIPFGRTVNAAAINSAPRAKVSFTFDDGLSSIMTNAQPTLAKYGLTGTSYVITNCVGMTTVPNTCRANNDAAYMTWPQIQTLQNVDGWEIGSHTVDHSCLASSAAQDPDDCQTGKLTASQVATELSQSKATLATNGVAATDFAPPYGDYNNAVLAQIAKYYATMRGFQDQNDNAWPYNEYLLNDVAVQEGLTPVSQIESKIDHAIANNLWLVLTFHDIVPVPSTNPDDYQYGTAELDQIAAYVAAKQSAGLLQSVHMNQGAVTSDSNLLPNGSFNSGITSGWTTDSASITADAGTNGSYPDATNAVKLTSPASGSAHLFSPKVSVDPYTTYMFKNFLNLQAIASGAVAFYVDEYDANGNWISGQYLKQESSAFVENMNFTYKPSSAAVSGAALQVIASGSGITAYLDNSQMFPLTSAAPTNLVANGTFDGGITGGWTTDSPATIRADAGSNGSPNNPVNSIALTAGGSAGNTHLFSPKVPVSSAHSYAVNAYLNVKALTSGEVGFYVDEYDANGNWISGKYMTGVRSVGIGTVGFTYTPSSSNVKAASLQVILVGNSGVTAYFDDVRWYQN